MLGKKERLARYLVLQDALYGGDEDKYEDYEIETESGYISYDVNAYAKANHSGDMIEWRERAEDILSLFGSMRKLENDIRDWQSKTFPEATTQSVFRHLQEEQRELRNLVYPSEWGESREAIKNEIGDNALLLMALAHSLGFTFESAIRDKFETARTRKYEYDPALGYAKHVD